MENRAAGELEGGKTRLEYNQTPPPKLDFSSFWDKAFCILTKCSAAEAQSKKSVMDFFDTQRARIAKAIRALCVCCVQSAVPPGQD